MGRFSQVSGKRDHGLVVSVRGSIGTWAEARAENTGWQISPNLFRIKPNRKRVDHSFFKFAFDEHIKRLVHRSVQSQALPALGAGDIKGMRLALPPLPEQRKIAEILRTWDEALEKLTAHRAAKVRRTSSLRQRLFEAEYASHMRLEHVLVSSGNAEIFAGTSIAPKFSYVYASKFMFDANGVAVWPALAVNYTTKTQYLFRINKGAHDLSNNAAVNKFVPKKERPVPFENMVFIGDGSTDISCFSRVKDQGGLSIAVYKPRAKGTHGKADAYSADGRVHCVVFEEAKVDALKRDWKQFSELKRSVQLRYQETVDVREFEPKIQKLLDDHVVAMPAETIIEVVNINDPDALKAVVEETGVSEASRADRIASATRRAITEKMDEDPTFYKQFSELLEETIRAYREKRLSEREYLNSVVDLASKVARKDRGRDVPESIRGDEDAQAFFGILDGQLKTEGDELVAGDDAAAIAQQIIDIIKSHLIVDIWSNEVAQNNLRNAIDDYFFDVLRDEKGVELPVEVLDELELKIMDLARARFAA
ncbi:type I restriction enzyme endonuclease domain-containing protein [Tropicimonas sp. IMCC6043]|uniref:type I restriction enzyme endonuclease domain-containing protein n=1 Tax=Tropicimonas sp. IMCC6043 TaxID=2510645 RepID=UPI001A92D541|nr:type I restriction enzyme endonuclease domain-containing protein [Tropicimonas sp. IMCC6043]